jgi:hypothetical protein
MATATSGVVLVLVLVLLIFLRKKMLGSKLAPAGTHDR